MSKMTFFSFSWFFSLLPLFLPTYFFVAFFFSLFSFLLPGFGSRNARATLVLIQTKFKQQQPLEIKETSLRI